MRTLKILAGLITVLFVSCSLWQPSVIKAQQKPDDWGTNQGSDIPLLDAVQEETVDEMQRDASEKLLETAEWIDSFFDDGRSIAEENTTRATLKLSLGYSKNNDFEIKPRFDLRLKLPQLSHRANIFIEAAEDEDFDIESDPISSRPAHTESENSRLTAGIKYFLKESKKYNISVDSGMSWNYLFAGLRLRAIHDLGEWQGRFTNRLRYYTDDGWENRATYDLEYQINKSLLFRTTTSAFLFEDDPGIPHSQYFRLYQVLSAYQALSYESGVYFDTKPSYAMTDTQLIVKYRQRFFRDWLILEISPRVSFPEDHDREPNPGIVFKLEAAIGYHPDEQGYRKVFR